MINSVKRYGIPIMSLFQKQKMSSPKTSELDSVVKTFRNLFTNSKNGLKPCSISSFQHCDLVVVVQRNLFKPDAPMRTEELKNSVK